jgi:Flp pilus assembly protein TadG
MRGLVSLPRSWPRLSLFASDCGGVSAIEFAMLLPIMITLFFGTIELSSGIAISRKLTLTAHTVADLASQLTDGTVDANSSDTLAASSTIMWPYANSPATADDQAKNLKIVLSCIDIDSNGTATITWSYTLNGTALGKGSAVSVPSALNIKNTGLIWGQASASYTPIFASNLVGTMNLADQFYLAPRKQMVCPKATSP